MVLFLVVLSFIILPIFLGMVKNARLVVLDATHVLFGDCLLKVQLFKKLLFCVNIIEKLHFGIFLLARWNTLFGMWDTVI